jgi:hypothetical protein
MKIALSLAPAVHAAGLPSDNFGHHMKGVEDIVQKGTRSELCS